MKTETQEGTEKAMEREISRKTYIPKLKPVTAEPLTDETAQNLFKAYFNNKMTVILMILQKKHSDQTHPESLHRAAVFFEDLFHHMLSKQYQKSHGRVFQWLGIFLKNYPRTKPMQKRKAMGFIRVVYSLFGIQWRL